MSKQHTYRATVEWAGNLGSGTSSYTAYSRDYTVKITGKPELHGSSDPAFRGDKTRHNPEDMLLAAISACHKLWYLHLCGAASIIVTAYTDHAEAVMDEGDNALPGRFIKATLRPQVTITQAQHIEQAKALHHEAHRLCFIANSLNFEVACECEITVA
ncbi:OsmC family protein [Eikenella corrodens]|uniref:OsmC family peroxiredoxin n=1 Tax=Eikenella corrodens TaxID=539 RepID=A0A3S9SGT0_EIKCO|nr:OsmC family protein [Eikenella corrodens]AZR58745.1 OsmC family peroxiredoxin [Eikenella corrodens]